MSFEWDVMLKPEKSASRKRCVDFDLLLGEAYARKKMLKLMILIKNTWIWLRKFILNGRIYL